MNESLPHVVVRAKRKSAVLTPSALPCLATVASVNLTCGCLHGCLYCYARSYKQYPGQGRTVLYENTLEKLQNEVARRRTPPPVVYFSPSSDLFQPAPEVLEMAEAVLEFLLGHRIPVAFVSKGYIPDRILRLLAHDADLVSAQIGLISTNEEIARLFEPNAAHPLRRLAQMQVLLRSNIPTEVRIDPILPTITDAPDEVDALFAALAGAGIKRAVVDALFLRPAITESLKMNLPDTEMLARLFGAFRTGRCWGRGYSLRLSQAVRRETFERMRVLAKAHGIDVAICACENPDLAHGSCNITGASRNPSSPPQLPLLPYEAGGNGSRNPDDLEPEIAAAKEAEHPQPDRQQHLHAAGSRNVAQVDDVLPAELS